MTNILQVGREDWSIDAAFKGEVEWLTLSPDHLIDELLIREEDEEDTSLKYPFDLVILSSEIDREAFTALLPHIEAHALIIDDRYETYYRQEAFARLLFQKQARFEAIDEPSRQVVEWAMLFFNRNYGERRHITEFILNDNYKKKANYEGTYQVTIPIDNTTFFQQLGFYRTTLPAFAHEYIELWLEYEKNPQLTLQMTVTYIQEGSLDNILKQEIFDDQALKSDIILTPPGNSYVTMVLSAKGHGELKLRRLHNRPSRKKYGKYIAGSKNLRDANREELSVYFNPGNLKPPLLVYFSGFRSAEGFEGYYAFKHFKHPFILVADPRLEGGAFYVNSDELQEKLLAFIDEKRRALGFSHKEMILSGLSMGTYGALYNGLFLDPYGIVIGKPLVSLGKMATNMTLKSPNTFPTAYDLVCSDMYQQQIKLSESLRFLDRRFFEVVEHTMLTPMTLAIAYMADDDYDGTAYYQLLEAFQDQPVKVISKGLPGRHNDNTYEINVWVFDRIGDMIREFERRDEEDDLSLNMG